MDGVELIVIGKTTDSEAVGVALSTCLSKLMWIGRNAISTTHCFKV